MKYTLIREFEKKNKFGKPEIYSIVKRSEGFSLLKKENLTFGYFIKNITHYYDNLEKLEKVIKTIYWKI
jgi:hypothetical protein